MAHEAAAPVRWAAADVSVARETASAAQADVLAAVAVPVEGPAAASEAQAEPDWWAGTSAASQRVSVAPWPSHGPAGGPWPAPADAAPPPRPAHHPVPDPKALPPPHSAGQPSPAEPGPPRTPECPPGPARQRTRRQATPPCPPPKSARSRPALSLPRRSRRSAHAGPSPRGDATRYQRLRRLCSACAARRSRHAACASHQIPRSSRHSSLTAPQ